MIPFRRVPCVDYSFKLSRCQNSILLESGIFAHIISSPKLGCTGLRQALKLVTNVVEADLLNTHRNMWGRRASDKAGADWCDTFTNEEMPETSNHQKPGERHRADSSSGFEAETNSASTLKLCR